MSPTNSGTMSPGDDAASSGSDTAPPFRLCETWCVKQADLFRSLPGALLPLGP
jgi:hypothetical protein